MRPIPYTRADVKSDMARIAKMKDEDIDFLDIPETTAEFWKNAYIVIPGGKAPVSLRLDRDVLDWFKTLGRGYQTRINAVLRAYMISQTRP